MDKCLDLANLFDQKSQRDVDHDSVEGRSPNARRQHNISYLAKQST
jgi:hypothetical protein